MFRSYLRHLYRDRRRFGLTALLLLGATILAPNSLPDPIPHVSTEIAASIALFLTLPLAAIYARQYRHFIEVFAFASFLLNLIGVFLPADSRFSLVSPNTDYVLISVFYCGLSLFSYRFLYGSWSDRLTPKRAFRVVTKMHSSADLRNLWYGLIAFPGHADLYADDEVVSVDYADPAHQVIRIIYWRPPDRRGEFLVFLDEVEKFDHIKMRMRIVEGISDAATQGVTQFKFRDTGKYRKVTMIFHADAVAPRRMLRHWLDDTVGRMMDNRVATIEWNAEHPDDRRQPLSYDEWWYDTETIMKSAKDNRHGYRTAHGRSLSAEEAEALDATQKHYTSPKHHAA